MDRPLFVTACSVKFKKSGPWVNCLGIGYSPDNDIETFILPNGKPYTGEGVWNYKMAPYEGCSKFS